MNRNRSVLPCLLSAMLVAGCVSEPTGSREPVNVSIEDDGDFPESLAGTWNAEDHGWEFVLAPDGRIVSAVISLGRVRVVPGQTATLPTKGGGKGVFVPGRWTVHYAPNSGVLTIRIVMDHVRVEMAGSLVEGTSTDVFAGPVHTEDGIWQSQWTSFTRYQVHTPEGRLTNLSTDPTYGETRPLTFRKLTDR